MPSVTPLTAPRPVSPEAIAAEVLAQLRDLLADEGAAHALRAALHMEDELLTFEDVMQLTGFGQDKLRELVRHQKLPMFRVDRQWRITRRAYREVAARGFADAGGRVMTRGR